MSTTGSAIAQGGSVMAKGGNTQLVRPSVDLSSMLYYTDRIDRIILFCSGLLKGQFAIFGA